MAVVASFFVCDPSYGFLFLSESWDVCGCSFCLGFMFGSLSLFGLFVWVCSSQFRSVVWVVRCFCGFWGVWGSNLQTVGCYPSLYCSFD